MRIPQDVGRRAHRVHGILYMDQSAGISPPTVYGRDQQRGCSGFAVPVMAPGRGGFTKLSSIFPIPKGTSVFGTDRYVLASLVG